MKKQSFVIAGAIVMLIASVLKGQASLEIRAASSAAVAGWQQATTPGGSPLWVAPSTQLTSADIARAEARTPPDGGRAVAITFTDAGARKIAELSRSQMNRPIALMLDGQVIWAPIVRGSIDKEAVLTGGRGGLTDAQISRLLSLFPTK